MRRPETRLSHQKSSRVTKSAKASTSRSSPQSLRPSPLRASAQSRSTSCKGLLGITLRYPYEVRKEDEYFADIPGICAAYHFHAQRVQPHFVYCVANLFGSRVVQSVPVKQLPREVGHARGILWK